MNNKGFIATSLMFSFFTVFAILAMTILATYTHYRLLTTNMSNYIQSELNKKISTRYVTLYNLVKNGDFYNNQDLYNSTCEQKDGSNKCCSSEGEQIDEGYKEDHGRKIPNTGGKCALALYRYTDQYNYRNYSGGRYIESISRIEKNESNKKIDLTNYKNLYYNSVGTITSDRKIYIRFRLYRKGDIIAEAGESNKANICINASGITIDEETQKDFCFNSTVTDDDGNQKYIPYFHKLLSGVADPTTDYFNEDSLFGFNKVLTSKILTLKNEYNSISTFNQPWELNIFVNFKELTPEELSAYISGKLYIEELMVIDVTDLYDNKFDEISDDEIKAYLDKYLDYFGNSCVNETVGTGGIRTCTPKPTQSPANSIKIVPSKVFEKYSK